METLGRAKLALWRRFRDVTGCEHDGRGYVRCSRMNLLPTITPEVAEQIEGDYREGSGKEWDSKICAIHSSAALAANAFGRWKDQPESLEVAGLRGFRSLTFEKKLATGLRGTPPNLDVLLEGREDVVGVESKLLETLTPKKPEFSATYTLGKLPQCEPQWWDLLELAKEWTRKHFDVAQMIKHYLGLRREFRDGRNVHLLYLFWRPQNATEFEEYRQHRQEIAEVMHLVAGSKVRLAAMCYSSLWDSWSERAALSEHAQHLKRRYCVEI